MRSTMILILALCFLVSCNKGKDAGAPNANSTENSESSAPDQKAASDVVNAELKTASGTELKTKIAQYSYLVGTNVATTFRQAEVELDAAIILEGLKDGFANKVTLNQDQLQTIMMDLNRLMNEQQRAIMEKQGAPNRAAAEKFLAENKTKPGVITTASGLQYKVLTKGKSTLHPKPDQFVKVNYEGHLADGTVFDSSYKRGQPASFRCNMVIRGWIEALQLMSPGDKFQLFVHPDLGYGPQGQGSIPSQSLLIFDVELLEVVDK